MAVPQELIDREPRALGGYNLGQGKIQTSSHIKNGKMARCGAASSLISRGLECLRTKINGKFRIPFSILFVSVLIFRPQCKPLEYSLTA